MPRPSSLNVVVSVWRGESNVAVCSVTDGKFLAELKRWAERQDYKLTSREIKLGPEHQ
jgi:hypothetical protein